MRFINHLDDGKLYLNKEFKRKNVATIIFTCLKKSAEKKTDEFIKNPVSGVNLVHCGVKDNEVWIRIDNGRMNDFYFSNVNYIRAQIDYDPVKGPIDGILLKENKSGKWTYKTVVRHMF